ncbi:LysR family transcriptional regulator [Streptomyces sp. M19]
MLFRHSRCPLSPTIGRRGSGGRVPRVRTCGRAGSFTLGAAAAGVPQSVASRRIAALERHFGGGCSTARRGGRRSPRSGATCCRPRSGSCGWPRRWSATPSRSSSGR